MHKGLLIPLVIRLHSPGTSKAGEPYKVGKRMTDYLLEILNLNKTEVISIDTLSNQEFTEVIDMNYFFFFLNFLLLS